MQKSYVYAGLLDDVLWRPPLGLEGRRDLNDRERAITYLQGRATTEDALLEQTLMTTALTGVILVVNDGYLLNLSSARRQLIDENSLLWQLIRVGQIKILSRNYHFDEGRGIHTLTEEMADEGVVSFRNLMAKKQPGSEAKFYQTELRPRLVEIHEKLRSSGGYYAWPPFDLGFGFHQRMSDVVGYQSTSIGISERYMPILESAFERFDADIRDRGFGAARTKWETSVNGVTNRYSKLEESERLLARREMMQLACEAYHFNFASLMRLDLSEEDNVAVITRTSGAFDDLLFDAEVGDPVVKVRDDEIPIPIFSERALEEFSGNAGFFRALFDSQSDLSLVRSKYVSVLNEFLNGGESAESLQKAEKDFVRSVAKHLGASEVTPGYQITSASLVTLVGIAASLSGMPTVGAIGAGVAGLVATLPGVLPYFVKKAKIGKMKRAKLSEIARFDEVPIVNVSVLREQCDRLKTKSFH